MRLQLEQFPVHSEIAQLKSLISKAFKRNEESDLIVFPELFYAGFNFENKAQTVESNKLLIRYIKKQCVDNKKAFAGTLLASTPSGFVNRLYYFDKKGNSRARYDKIHLISGFKEPQNLKPGKSTCLLAVSEFQIGFTTCYDLRFPELFRRLLRKGATLFIVCAQWPEIRKEHMITLAKARAIENQSYLALCNASANGMAGHSMVIDPSGNILSRLKKPAGTLFENISIKPLLKYRSTFPAVNEYLNDPG